VNDESITAIEMEQLMLASTLDTFDPLALHGS